MTARLTTAQPDLSQDMDSWEWLREAACAGADPELFFPVGDSGPAAEQTARAKEVCHGCPVERQCLEWALATGRTSGVWGGTDENERRKLRRRTERRRSPGASADRRSRPPAPGGSRRRQRM
jgi:WhiB family transcriptional regulator, redox-sensing transcriptional regulator